MALVGSSDLQFWLVHTPLTRPIIDLVCSCFYPAMPPSLPPPPPPPIAVEIATAATGVRIQKELISDLIRKNEEIRGKRLGQL
jgi:hypothetical protein